MSTVYEVPLSPTPQVMSIALGGVKYSARLTWAEAENGGWTLDLMDSSGEPLVQGIPLVTGIDLLGQYAHLGFKGQLRVQTDNNPDAVPTFENLGVESHLYFVADA